MKKFVLLFLTLSGINVLWGQTPGHDARIESMKTDSNSVDRSNIHVTPAPRERPTLRLFPNPAKNRGSLEIKGFEPGYVQVQLTNSTGNMVRDDKRLVFNGNEIIMLMFSLQTGLYLLAVRQNKRIATARLIIR